MTKKETIKWIVQIIASVATAIVTALSATSCVGINREEAFWRYLQGALSFARGCDRNGGLSGGFVADPLPRRNKSEKNLA